MKVINDKRKTISAGIKLRRRGIIGGILRNNFLISRMFIFNTCLSLIFPNIYLILLAVYLGIEIAIVLLKNKLGPSEQEMAENIMLKLNFDLLEHYNYKGRSKEKVEEYLRIEIYRLTGEYFIDLKETIDEYAKYCNSTTFFEVLFQKNDKIVDTICKKNNIVPEIIDIEFDSPLVILHKDERGNISEVTREELQKNIAQFWSEVAREEEVENLEIRDDEILTKDSQAILKRTRSNSMNKK